MTPMFVNDTTTAVKDLYSNPATTGINLFNNWTKITLHQYHLFQKGYLLLVEGQGVPFQLQMGQADYGK